MLKAKLRLVYSYVLFTTGFMLLIRVVRNCFNLDKVLNLKQRDTLCFQVHFCR